MAAVVAPPAAASKGKGWCGAGKGWDSWDGAGKGWGGAGKGWGGDGKGWGGKAAAPPAQAKGGWTSVGVWVPGFDGKGKGGKGKDAGKFGKGKGKDRPRGPSGPELPRTRITQEPVTGEVVEWRGKYGWIKPTVPVEHETAEKRKGNIYVSMSDLVGGVTALTAGSLCQFHIFTDPSGLGAEEVLGS
uniref:Uncharacterized protein n=1 Tax=Zooxanthella nutricula TaxID=1333877 RepID=A0A7S2JQ89_9DINO